MDFAQHAFKPVFVSLNDFDMPPWSLVSPASRGIGFALAKHVLHNTNAPVVATARKDLDKLREELLEGTGIAENRLKVLKLDVLGRFVRTISSKLS